MRCQGLSICGVRGGHAEVDSVGEVGIGQGTKAEGPKIPHTQNLTDRQAAKVVRARPRLNAHLLTRKLARPKTGYHCIGNLSSPKAPPGLTARMRPT